MIIYNMKLFKHDDLEIVNKKIVSYSVWFVKTVFRNERDFKTSIKRLKNIETYINKHNNIHINIMDIIIDILCNIYVTDNGDIVLNDVVINGLKTHQIYKLISFGNIGIKKSAIFNDALNYAVSRLEMSRLYGC